VISVNIGLSRQITWDGKTVSTRILNKPITRRVAVRFHNSTATGPGPYERIPPNTTPIGRD
jgi:hypothetical protein